MAVQTPLPPLRLNIEGCVRFLTRDPARPRVRGLGILWRLSSFTVVGACFAGLYAAAETGGTRRTIAAAGPDGNVSTR